MIDTHHHLLPGVDDGARDMEETLEMARWAVADGITTVVCTPHAWKGVLDVDPSVRDAVLADTRKALAEANIPLTLIPGFECTLCSDLVKTIGDDPRYFLGTSRKTVLLEWPEEQSLNGLEHILFEAQLAGFEIILAHAERYADVKANPSVLQPFVDRGLHVQILAKSLNATFSWKTKRTVTTLLRSGLVHLIATDAHDSCSRRSSLRQAVNKAKSIIGPQAEDMVTKTPERLLGL